MSLSVEHKSKSYLILILTSLDILFCYTDIDSTNSLITKYEISSLSSSFVVVQFTSNLVGNPKISFPMMWLIISTGLKG